MASASATGPLHHGTYYIASGDVVFEVENTLFRVHRFFFERESRLFRDMLSLPVPTADAHPAPPALEGTSDNNPIKLPQVLSAEFELLLWVFYNPTFSQYDAPASTWSAILRLAHRWDFPSVRALAFRELRNTPPATRLALGERYDAPADWRARALAELVARADPLTRAEGAELGLEMVLKVAEMREQHHRHFGARSSRRRPRGRYDDYYPYIQTVYRQTSRSRSRSPSGSPPPQIEPIVVPPPEPLVFPAPVQPWVPEQPFVNDYWVEPVIPPPVPGPNAHQDGERTRTRSRTLRFFKNVLGRKKKN